MIRSALDGYALDRVGVEAQAFSPWLFTELRGMGLPAIVVEAVHMQKALSAQHNKTDRNDARGIVRMMRVGWFRQVHVKSSESQHLETLPIWDRRLRRTHHTLWRFRGAEAANGLMVRCKKWSALRAWGIGVAKRRGHKRAIVAVARKLAAVLHRMWLDGTEFRWTRADGSHGGNAPAIAIAA